MSVDDAVQSLGGAIRQARIDAGLTQSELGEFMGVDRFAVAKLESGRMTTQLRRLIEALDAVGLELTVVPRSRRFAMADSTPPNGSPSIGDRQS